MVCIAPHSPPHHAHFCQDDTDTCGRADLRASSRSEPALPSFLPPDRGAALCSAPIRAPPSPWGASSARSTGRKLICFLSCWVVGQRKTTAGARGAVGTRGGEPGCSPQPEVVRAAHKTSPQVLKTFLSANWGKGRGWGQWKPVLNEPHARNI